MTAKEQAPVQLDMLIKNTGAKSADSEVTTMTSREIAELTGKRHTNVLRDIDKIRTQIDRIKLESVAYIIENGKYLAKNGELSRELILNRNATELLILGYSLKARIRVHSRLKELEKQIAMQPILPTNYEEALTALLGEVKTNRLLAVKVAEQAPAVAFANTVGASENSVLFATFAKTLQSCEGAAFKIKDVREWLVANKYIFKRGREWLYYSDKAELFDLIDRPYKDIFGVTQIATQLRISGKGQQVIGTRFIAALTSVA